MDKGATEKGATDKGGGQVFVEFQLAGGDDDAIPHPLRDITDLELEEIRQLKHPPETVSRVMECVHLILGGDGPPKNSNAIDWHSVLKTVVRANFLRQVRKYSLEDMRAQPSLVDYLCREYLTGPNALGVKRVRRASRAVVAFFGWTVSLIAGVLPEWPVDEVGGREAREVVLMLEADRVAIARRADQEEKARLEAAKEEEDAKRAEAERKEEAERQKAEQEEAKRREAEQVEAERREEERRRTLKQEEEAQAKRLEEQKRLEEKAAKAPKERKEKEEDPEIFSPSMVMWDTSGNPERKFLQVDGAVVHFPSADFVSCCNVVTREPVRRGVHFFEFVMHALGGEQWCGVTTDSTQAGMRVSGWNLKSWSYYCGDREATPQGQPALHVNKKVVQRFAHVKEGDVVGLLLDADRRGLAFLRNGELQGTCELIPRNRSPLFLLTHVGAGGDRVELRRQQPERAPRSASTALEALLGKVVPVQ